MVEVKQFYGLFKTKNYFEMMTCFFCMQKSTIVIKQIGIFTAQMILPFKHGNQHIWP